jgi:hypothetical protein
VALRDGAPCHLQQPDRRESRPTMSPLDALWHVANLFVPAIALGALAATLTKWLWRRELAAVSWVRLAGPASAVCAAASVLCLLILGGDGTMASYTIMVLACTIMLWWRAFGPGRR